jgi:hypothetical protein
VFKQSISFEHRPNLLFAQHNGLTADAAVFAPSVWLVNEDSNKEVLRSLIEIEDHKTCV